MASIVDDFMIINLYYYFMYIFTLLLLLQVKLSNPSSKPLVYRGLVAGLDSRDFCLSKGDSIPIGAKSSVNVTVQFKSRYMRSSDGVLLFTGRRHGSTVGSTLVFSLKSRVNNITPQVGEEVMGGSVLDDGWKHGGGSEDELIIIIFIYYFKLTHRSMITIHSMTRRSQVIIRVEFNCLAAM